MKKYVETANNHRRTATYSDREVKCKNTSPLFHRYGAKPGMMAKYYYTMNDGSRCYEWGRVLGRVDAPFVKSDNDEYDCPEVKGWIAVLEIGWCGHIARVRWVNPDTVTELYDAPQSLPAWFFQEELPSIEHILAADRHGSLHDAYIDRWVKEHSEEKKP